MKHLNTTFFFIFLALLTFTQCRKDKKEFVPFCEEFPEQCVDMERIKDHYYFKTGSWWIYQEVTSHQLDSQWVSQDWVSDCDFDLVIKSNLDDYDRHRWGELLTPAKDCGLIQKKNYAYIERSKYKAGSYIGGSYIGLFYPNIGDYLYNWGGGGYPSLTYQGILKIKNIHSNYSIFNETFLNVIEIKDQYNIVENSQPTTHFYAEGVGLIKKELIDSNQTWLLIDYNVEQ